MHSADVAIIINMGDCNTGNQRGLDGWTNEGNGRGGKMDEKEDGKKERGKREGKEGEIDVMEREGMGWEKREIWILGYGWISWSEDGVKKRGRIIRRN